MPENIIKYRVFIASPSDVLDERLSIDEVIKELNLTFGQQNKIIIETVKWETHSAPGIANKSVQEIINNDIGYYDLFIGLLWKKFGTPTDKAESGTEEEFNNAYSRYLASPQSIQILFYFNNSAPASLNEIDITQLSKVKKFKETLGEKNVLYWEYNKKEELEQFLRLHIPKRISDITCISEPPHITPGSETTLSNISTSTGDELGIFDFHDLAEEYFEVSTNALIRISTATEWVGEEIGKKAQEMNGLAASGNQVGKKILRDFFLRTASVMNDYANRIAPEIPIFISNFEKGSEAYTNLIEMHRLYPSDSTEDETATAISSITHLNSHIQGAIDNMAGFLASVSGLPRIAKEINEARSNMEAKLKELLDKLTVCKDIGMEIEKNLKTNSIQID